MGLCRATQGLALRCWQVTPRCGFACRKDNVEGYLYDGTWAWDESYSPQVVFENAGFRYASLCGGVCGIHTQTG